MTAKEQIAKLRWMAGVCVGCIDSSEEHDTIHDTVESAIAAIRAQQEAEKNEPLTVEELERLEREPVYLVTLGEDFDDGWQLCVKVDHASPLSDAVLLAILGALRKDMACLPTPAERGNRKMKIRKVIDICKRSGMITLYSGETEQWISDGGRRLPDDKPPAF